MSPGSSNKYLFINWKWYSYLHQYVIFLNWDYKEKRPFTCTERPTVSFGAMKHCDTYVGGEGFRLITCHYMQVAASHVKVRFIPDDLQQTMHLSQAAKVFSYKWHHGGTHASIIIELCNYSLVISYSVITKDVLSHRTSFCEDSPRGFHRNISLLKK